MIGSTLVIASNNTNKITELRMGLEGFGLQIRSLLDFTDIGEIKEDGDTFKANALIKARLVYNATGLTSLADDSGLEVDALDGAPGVFSHRFAGPKCNDEANNELLIEKMKGYATRRRTARFRSVLALVWGPDEELTVGGICEGTILTAPQGSGGFGYDPLFYMSGLKRTMAEISLEEKNKISHRARSMDKLRRILRQGLV